MQAFNIIIFIYLYFILFIFKYAVASNCEIAIKDTGIESMKPGEVGMVFFLIIENPCSQKFFIHTQMINCIELIGESEEETEAMYLLGGYMGPVYSKNTLKATLIYPNMYRYNRRGLCTISITYTNDKIGKREIRTHVKFDTTPQEKKVPVAVRSFFKKHKYPLQCDTVDLDNFDKCQPVDCMMKYLGYRNYFNERWKRCQKVPICVSDAQKDEPDVAYMPTSNRCRNLAECITESDINMLEEGVVANFTDNFTPSRGLRVRCNHGVLDNTTGLCKCKDHWSSGDNDLTTYSPGLSLYHMCNVRIDSWNSANMKQIRSTVLFFSVLAVMITMAILLLTFCLYGIYIFMQNQQTSPFESSEMGSSDLNLDYDDNGSGKSD